VKINNKELERLKKAATKAGKKFTEAEKLYV